MIIQISGDSALKMTKRGLLTLKYVWGKNRKWGW